MLLDICVVFLILSSMEQHTLKNVNSCLNNNIYYYLKTSGVQSSNIYSNVVHIFNTSVNLTSEAARDSCFPALVSNMCCSIIEKFFRISIIFCCEQLSLTLQLWIKLQIDAKLLRFMNRYQFLPIKLCTFDTYEGK